MTFLYAIFDLATWPMKTWFAWLETWPLWLKVLLIVTVTPVMVLHFLAWIRWHLGLGEDEDHGKVVPFRKRNTP